MTAPLPAPPIEDDTERVERVARLIAEHDGYCYDAEADAIRCLCGFADPEDDDDGSHARHVAAVLAAVLAADLSPSPDRLAEVREQTLREAEQAVRALADDRALKWEARRCWGVAADTIAALASGTPTTEERQP